MICDTYSVGCQLPKTLKSNPIRSIHMPTSSQVENGQGNEAKKPTSHKTIAGALFIIGLCFAAGVGLQHILMQIGVVDILDKTVWAAFVGVVGFLVVIAGGISNRWRRFVSSFQFAVAAILAVTMLSILGTVILQNQPQSVLGAAYSPSILNAVQGMFLDDIFRSFGFCAVLGVGSGGLTMVTLRRRRWTVFTLGSVGAHLGILLTLGGAAIGMAWGVRGHLNLHEGESSDHFEVEFPDGRKASVPLGFVVRLDDFKLELYEPAYRFYLYEPDGKGHKILAAVDPEQSGALEKYGVQVVEYWPDYHERIVVEILGEQTEKKAQLFSKDEIEPGLALKNADGTGDILWKFENQAGKMKADEDKPDGLVFFWSKENAERRLKDLESPKDITPHVLLVEDGEIPLQLGRKTVIEKLEIEVELVKAFNDFIIDMKTKKPENRSNNPINPAIELVVRDLKGIEITKQWLFSKHPSFHGNTNAPVMEKLAYRYDEKRTPEQIRLIVVGDSKQVWHLDGRQLIKKEPLTPGYRLTLATNTMVVVGIYEKTGRTLQPYSRSQRANNPVARIFIPNQNRQQTLREKRPVKLPDGKFLALASKNKEDVRDYLSTVTIIEEGRPILSRTVEVNHPLGYRGYSIFQSNYRREDPTFSGFSIMKDPGLWLVFLGLMLNSAGVLVVLFGPPFIKRKRAKLKPRPQQTSVEQINPSGA